MKKLCLILFTMITLFQPLYSSDSFRLSLDGGLGGLDGCLSAGTSISFDRIQKNSFDYRITLLLEGGGVLFHGDYDDTKLTSYGTLMLYGGVAKNYFTKYLGYQLSLNLGAGGVQANYDDSLQPNIDLYGEVRGYLGPLFLFARAGVSKIGGHGMIGLGLSTFSL